MFFNSDHPPSIPVHLYLPQIAGKYIKQLLVFFKNNSGCFNVVVLSSPHMAFSMIVKDRGREWEKQVGFSTATHHYHSYFLGQNCHVAHLGVSLLGTVVLYSQEGKESQMLVSLLTCIFSITLSVGVTNTNNLKYMFGIS